MTCENAKSENESTVDGAVISLQAFLESHNYAGYDPYDAQNSPLMSLLSLGTKVGRIAWTQLLRRLPVNIRPLLLIRPGRNPKALGLFLEGYVRLYRMDPSPETLNSINHLIGLLDKCKTKTMHGHGWGYNFDWQSRAFLAPKFTPTIVNSAFIGHALLDASEHILDPRAVELAAPIGEFILRDLNRIIEKDGFCFSYTPIDHYAVHNANLLGASLLIRLWKLLGLESYREASLAALRYSIRHQHDDGSWFYAQKQGSQWIDSFHTGFNLEAVRHFLRLGEAAEYEEAFQKGLQYYAGNFFLQDGTPKYYHNRVYPLDIHSPAEAIAFFSEEGGYEEFAGRVLNWMLENMADPQGYFYFRKGRFLTNKIPYMRWGQAWAFRALTAYAHSQCAKPVVALSTRF